MEFTLREYASGDEAAVLRLNAESVTVLSPMDENRLRLLARMASFHVVAVDATGVIGFVMGFSDGALYNSVNYHWFAVRYKRFLYLDRMVVAPSLRGHGVGRALHAAAEQYAIASGLDWLVGEIDLDPPNPESLAFHERLGFVEVGRQALPSGKTVSMRARRIEACALFSPIASAAPGAIARLLRASYAELLRADPRWTAEQASWDEYDREAFANPGTVGACLFFTWLGDRVVGFASWDPRPRPEYGIVGHNCVLPEFRRRGLGRRQVEEVLRRLRGVGIDRASVSTADHPFFLPAQRAYLACGFREVNRAPWDRDPSVTTIEYEKRLD